MEKFVFEKDSDLLAEKAASLISSLVRKLLAEKDHVVIGIPGGNSVKGLFRKFCKSNIPWDKVRIFWVDERVVPEDSNESNFRLAKNLFIDFLVKNRKISMSNVYPFVMDKKIIKGLYNSHNITSDKKGIASKQISMLGEELRSYNLGFSKCKKFDILIFGVGEDGHIASLFPKHSSVMCEKKEFFPVFDSPKPPSIRITASKSMFLDSDYSITLFLGNNKIHAFKEFNNPNISIKDCPAKIVKKIKNSYIFTDIPVC